MAKVSLASMSVQELLKLREALERKAGELRHQLVALGADVGKRGRASTLKGRKVAAKYRGPNGETWGGRGAMPR